MIDGEAFGECPAQRLAAWAWRGRSRTSRCSRGLSVRDNVAAGLVHTRRASFVEQITRPAAGAARSARRSRRGSTRSLAFLRPRPHRSTGIAGTLPYGLQKRVELARALVAGPNILLLDEPMAGMTAGEKVEMAGFVRAARDQLGTSVILIEHDIGVVMGLSDRIAVLDYGRKIADGSARPRCAPTPR